MQKTILSRSQTDEEKNLIEMAKNDGWDRRLGAEGCGQEIQQPTPSGPAVSMFLTETELANRWNVSVKLLQKFRWLGGGPRYCKFGSAVRYAVSEIEEFEVAASRRNTSDGK